MGSRLAAALAAASLLFVGGAAFGAEGDPFLKTCLSTTAAPPCVASSPTFQGGDAEVSPDGRHLYAAVWKLDSSGWTGIRLYDIGADGALTQRTGAAGCYAHLVAGCTNTANEYGGSDIDFSADGRNLYLTGNGALVVFNRDTSTGTLLETQCFGSSPGCTAVPFGQFSSAALSPDGMSLYLRGNDFIGVFDRNTATGQLTQKPGAAGCVVEESPAGSGCTVGHGTTGNGLETTVSSDGRHLYVASTTPGGVAIFNRNPANGTITQPPGTAACVTTDGTSGSTGGIECTAGGASLGQATAVTLDTPGAYAFVSGAAGHTVLRRDAATGLMTKTDCLDETGGAAPPAGCHEVKGAAGADAAVTPDGNHVVLNAQNVGVSFLVFDRGTGKVSQRSAHGCFTDTGPGAPCDYVPGLLRGPGGVAVAPSGLLGFSALRVQPASGGSIASFVLDAAPSCQSKTIAVKKRTALRIPLTCTDPNGDVITLEIQAPPTWGTLSAIDQSADRVTYTPPPARKGKDTFKYGATARGATGPAATVTLTITAAPKVIDRKAPNTRLTAAPKSRTKLRGALFRFRSTERKSTFQCKLDKTSWQRCKSPKRYRIVKPGRHTFQVRAMDRAGNVDVTPARKRWKRIR
jgi:Bacterial Ig domain/WD40-like Beta Propeller Repeat